VRQRAKLAGVVVWLSLLAAQGVTAQEQPLTPSDLLDQAQLEEMLVALDEMIAQNDKQLVALQERIALTNDLEIRARLEQAASQWTKILDALEGQRGQVSALLDILDEGGPDE
jgi:hypothetical protein